SAVDPLAARSDVARIDPNPAIALRFPARTPRSVMPEAIASLPWGVSKIQAPAVWSAGFRGAGVVVANEDTGVQWDHPALKAQYRGWNGSSVDHDYNWHDAVADTACRAGGVSAPCDPNSHGTHTTGTMAGDDGADHPIGVAPGARWIHCRNMDASGTGTTASYIECLQWLLAPTDLSGANPNPDLAPDVVNNSWYCAVSEGCTSGNELAVAVNNLVAGGIFFAAAAGNSGSDCQTIAGPPAIYDAAFVVGATDATETLASFSSRGPVGGSALIRPDVSAPGVNISSSVPGSGYDIKQGTSMATPHVAGAAALLMSAFPALKGRPAEVVAILRATAVHDVLDGVPGQNCGSTPITTWPNFMAGYGRVDAWNAYHELIFIDGLDD
ncbi:MAG TPA: S8 family serine peptidase, partial [Rudaea sp.]